MNPYLKAQRAKYEELRVSVTEVQTRAANENRDLSEDELRSVQDTAEEMRTVADQIEYLTDLESRSQSVREMAASLYAGGEATQDPAAPFSLQPTTQQLDELRTAVGNGDRHYRLTLGRTGDDWHNRATVTLAETDGPVAGVGGRLPEPRRIVTAVGLTPTRVDSNGATAPLFGATSGQAPTGEGETKPEADSVSPLNIDVHALARWTDVSRHGMLSDAGFLSQLTSWHAQHIAKDEDRLLVTALTTAAGTPIGTGDGAADVRTAVATVTDAVSADADIVVCNPADYATVSAFAPTSGSDVASFADRIGRAVIYPSSSVTAGTVLVAALRAGGRFVVAESPSVIAVEAPKVNVTTIRTEELVGFGVRLAGSVVAVDLNPA